MTNGQRFQQQFNIDTGVIGDYALVGQQKGEAKVCLRRGKNGYLPVKSLELWASKKYFAGIKVTYIPHKGGKPKQTSLLGGHTMASWFGPNEWKPHGDKVRPRAIATKEPIAATIR